MIKDRNIANDAQIQLHKIMGSAGMFVTGEIFWVGTDDDASYNAMKNRVKDDHLFTSIDTAFGSCVANRGDVIVVMEGHSESVSEAGALDMDVAGVTVVFLGSGTSKANITFDTAVTADMDIDAADITLINPKFVAGIDALTGPIDVNATDFTIINGEWHDATDIETTDCIVATSGATRLKIDGWRFFKSNEGGTQKESHIQLNGVDDAILKNINVEGDFDAGVIENVTDELLRVKLENLFLTNTDPGNAPAIVLDSACDGWAENVHLRNANGTVVSDNSDINWGPNCMGYSTDGAAGEPIGTANAAGLEGKVDIIDAYHDVATADAATNAVMSDVIGNKTDAAINAATTTKTLMAYLKGVLNEIAVPSADNTDNGFINDVIGQKTDAAATGSVTTTDTLVAYIKQLVTELGVVDGYHDVAVADAVTNAVMSDVVGNKEDAAAAGAVSTTESIMAYVKQLVGELQTADSNIDSILTDTGTTLPATLAALPQCVEKSDGAILTGSDDLFVVAGGPVRAKIVGHVTTVIGGATDLRLQHTTTDPAATVDLNAGAVTCDNDAVGTVYHNLGSTSVFTPSGGLGFVLLDPVTKEETEFILAPGTVKCLSTAAQTGNIKWYMTFEPLSPSSTVTAAA